MKQRAAAVERGDLPPRAEPQVYLDYLLARREEVTDKRTSR